MALICLDLDGTLLHEGKPVKGALESIKALKANGHTVALATGRSPLLLYDLDKILEVDNLVLANGCYVSVKGELIFENYISNEIIKKTMDYSDENQVDLVIEYDDEYIAYRKDTDLPDKFCDIFKIQRPKLDREFYPERKVFSMLAFEDEDVVRMRVALPDLEFNKSNAYGYDVNLKGGLKADGIKAMADYLGFKMKDVYAIGDGFNDKTMIMAVGHGIAMGNSGKGLKQVAEYITTDVNDYGVWNALKHYGLI